jgi:hypothetical protein
MRHRRACAMILTALSLTPALAQSTSDKNSAASDSPAVRAPDGRTPPEDKGVLQPQGWTGPINTGSGGAPAESPQGQSPPGMQAAPAGSTKTVTEPDKK